MVLNSKVLLREYLRTARRVKNAPSPDGFKKLEYLRFIGANLCPDCGEEVSPALYVCTKSANGQVREHYHCTTCGTHYLFSQEPIH